ncbi:tetratricopeptide repeat protein [Candidatus Acetothermia bacterium]|nr:tetratricopeptide repeat protein [Candidatus Acetothermia bacterium]MBI3643551.1 tetratricopeptide repeat protein [Candidatus Acetothermia bacterium]
MPDRSRKQKRFHKRFSNVIIWVIIFAFMGGVIIFFAPNGLQILEGTPTTPDQPALVVNGDAIGVAKLDFETITVIEQQKRLYKQFNLGNFEDQLLGAKGAKRHLDLRDSAADQLVRQQVLLQEANKRHVAASSTQVALRFRQQYDQMLQSFQISEADLDKFLKTQAGQTQFVQILHDNGIMELKTGTLGEFKDELRKEQETSLKDEKLQDAVVGDINPTDKDLISFVEGRKSQYQNTMVGPYAPTDDELSAYFKNDQDKYAVVKAKVRQIEIDVPAGTTDAEMKPYNNKMAEAQALLKTGKDFSEVVKQYSDDPYTKNTGGVTDYFEKGKSPYDTATDTAFSNAAFSQAIGEQKVIRTSKGLHLIEVTDRKTTSFDEAKDSVKQDLTSETQDAKWNKWLLDAKDKGLFPQAVEIHARHILINLPQTATPGQVQSASKKMDGIIVQLKSGTDFAALAKQYSDDTSNKNSGGDLGWFGRGKMVPEFDQAAFALQDNQLSAPVRTQYGFHIIQVLEHRTTDAEKEQVKTDYNTSEKQKRFDEWVKKTITSSKIDIKDPLLFAYDFEKKAKDVQTMEEKFKRYDQAIQAYEQAKQGVSGSTVSDQFIGYYESDVYRSKVELLQQKLDKLGSSATEAQKKELQDQITAQQALATKYFLESAAAMTKDDSQIFQQAISDDQTNADLRYSYALFLRDQMSDEDAAYEQLTKSVELDPNRTAAHLAAADIQINKGAYDLAIQHLNAALPLVKDGSTDQQDIQITLAQAHLQKGKASKDANELAQAEKLLSGLKTSMQQTDPRYADLLSSLGDVYLEQSKPDAAEQAFRASLKLSNKTDVEVNLGLALLAEKKLDEAVTTLKRVSARDVYSVAALVGLGDAYLAQGKKDDALAQYKDALTRNSGSSDDSKIAIGTKILGVKPDDTDTRLELADIYMSQKVLDKALDHYQQILQTDPKSWKAQKGIGEIHRQRNEFNDAMNFFKSALLNQPPTADQVEINQKILDVDQVIVGFNNPYDADGQEAMLNLASLYSQQGNYVEARKRLDDLKNKYPKYQPDKVASMINDIEGSADLGPDGLPGQPVQDQGRTHIDQGTTHDAYTSLPPTSGPHYITPAPYGITDKPIPDENQVHDLEHGAVIIQYQPKTDASVVSTITAFVNGLRKDAQYCKLIVAPYPNLDKPIAVTAWDRIMKLDQFDEKRVTTFIKQFINKGPEQVNDCQP